MAKKKSISESEFAEIVARAVAAFDNPLPELIFDEAELSLPVPIPTTEVLNGPTAPCVSTHHTPPHRATRAVSIRIPVHVIHSFKQRAESGGSCYQSLMIRALKQAAESFV